MKIINLVCFTIGLVMILASGASAGKRFDHVVVVVLENADYEDVIQDPFFKTLATQGAIFANFSAIAHPSYPNYLAMVAGSAFDNDSDEQTTIQATSIVDLLESKKLTWKAYAEDYPGNCFLDDDRGMYARKHVPFASFDSIQNNPDRCAQIVAGDQFKADWKNHKLPNYSFFTPNMDNDGHDTSFGFAGEWLKKFIKPLLDDKVAMKRTLIEITFDEGTYFGNNQIYTLFLGSGIKPGTVIKKAYNHYNVLRTIEDNFELGNLDREDKSATVIEGLWKPENLKKPRG
jgi:hypothetical protein